MSKAERRLDLPSTFEPFREKIEASIKPFVHIETDIVGNATLQQSKFLGKPYFPKSMSFPTTREGNPLYLLAQINFAEVPYLEGFPRSGILQFYLSNNDADRMYGLDFDNPTRQDGFRAIYHPTPLLDESALITNFDFMPSIWTEDESSFPFRVYSKYLDKPESCFALTFAHGEDPISTGDYRYTELTGHDPYAERMNSTDADKSSALMDQINAYEGEQVKMHQLGGHPVFTQSDPRSRYATEKEPYELLLQIDSEATNKIDIIWGDLGICNFFIKPSALKALDFSNVLYNWDCG